MTYMHLLESGNGFMAKRELYVGVKSITRKNELGFSVLLVFFVFCFFFFSENGSIRPNDWRRSL